MITSSLTGQGTVSMSGKGDAEYIIEEGLKGMVTKDVLPFTKVSGHPAHPHGINAEGLRRRGFSAERIRAIRGYYKLIYRSGLRLEEALDGLDRVDGDDVDARRLAAFIRSAKRSILR